MCIFSVFIVFLVSHSAMMDKKKFEPTTGHIPDLSTGLNDDTIASDDLNRAVGVSEVSDDLKAENKLDDIVPEMAKSLEEKHHSRTNTTFHVLVWNYVSGLLEDVLQEFSSSIEKEDAQSTVLAGNKEDNVELTFAVPPAGIQEQNESFNGEENITTANEYDINKKINQSEIANQTEMKKKFYCVANNVTKDHIALAKIVNGSELLSILRMHQNNSIDGECAIVLFYTPWCPFCARLAPHYNALGRAFKQLDILAVNAMDFSNLNVRFGTVAVPHIILFRNSRPVMRFNNTHRTFDNLVSFIVNVTGLEANRSVNVTDMDYFGPLSSVTTRSTNYLLVIAWIFLIVSTLYIAFSSLVGQRVINEVRILWHEHQHIN